MKLLVISGLYGHVELMDANDTVKHGAFAGLNQRQLFEKIMEAGYGKNIPAVFHTTFKNGEVLQIKSKDEGAGALVDRPDVESVWILAPMAGG